MIGDILVTRPGSSDKVIATPLVHEMESLLQEQSVSTSLSQKVVILHPQVCAGWAGSYIQAANFLEQLSKYLTNQIEINRFELERLIRNCGEISDLQFIVYAKTDGGFFHMSTCPRFDLGYATNLRVSGSGTPFFINNVERVFSLKPKGNLGAYQTVATHALAFCADSSVKQLLKSEGVNDRWGGGFEIIMFDGEKFYKPEILWLFWHIVGDGDTSVAQIVNKLMYQYSRNGESYFWVDHGQPKPSDHFQVSAPHATGVALDLVTPSIYETYQVINLFSCAGPSETGSGAFIETTGSGQIPSVRLHREGEKTTLEIDNSFFERFAEGLPKSIGKLEGFDWAAWGKASD